MTITVTGATGHLGRLILENLKGQDVVAAVRNTSQDLGVPTRHADYDRPETLRAAFEGTDTLVFISASEAGKRIGQHRAVVDAAKAANVGLIIYTSITAADTSASPLAPEHIATEEYIKASGLPYTFLRNNWYFENYTAGVAATVEHGVLLGSAGKGRIAGATRADYAAGAAAVATGEGHAGKIYELGGDETFSLDELAAAISAQYGKEVVYRDLPVEDYAQALVGFGVPEGFAKILAESDVSIANGALDLVTGDLRRLIGRPTTTLAEALRN